VTGSGVVDTLHYILHQLTSTTPDVKYYTGLYIHRTFNATYSRTNTKHTTQKSIPSDSE